MNQEEKTKRIRELNDEFRLNKKGGLFVITEGVRELKPSDQISLFQQVHQFDSWSEKNDPYHQHDFGALDFKGQRYFWKIEYYAKNDMNHGSEDPTDKEKTTRVLTIMRADEY